MLTFSLEVTTKCFKLTTVALAFFVWLLFSYDWNFSHMFLYKVTNKSANNKSPLFLIRISGTRGWWLWSWLFVTQAEIWGSGNTEGRLESSRISNVVFLVSQNRHDEKSLRRGDIPLVNLEDRALMEYLIQVYKMGNSK